MRGENPTPDTNLRGGEFEGIDTTGVPDGGTYQTPWEYDYTAADTLLESDDDNNYYTNGTGGYYAEAKEPEPEVSYDYEYNDIVVEESGQEVRTGQRRREILSGGLYGEWEPWEYDPIGTAYEDAVMSNANWRYTSACGEFVYKNAHKPVTANGTGGYTLGEEVYDGPSAGAVLQICEQENLRYISDGAGYYTTEDTTPPPPPCEDSALHVDGQDGWSYDGCYWTYTPNCPSSGEMVDSTNQDVTYNGSGCGTWTIGVSWTSTYTDGNCGTYTNSGTTYNVGDIGTCNGYIYSVDSEGYVSSRPDCPAQDTVLDSGTPSDITYETPCGTYTIGYSSQHTYADGACGSYQASGNTYNVGDFTTCNGYIYSVDSNGNVESRPEPTCPPNGEWINGDDCYDYYHDGNCGSYSVDNGNCGGGGGCDSSGIQIGSGSEPIYASTPCGDVQVGTTDYIDYTDGSCGSYRSYGDPVYVESGTQVGSCNDCNYFSNGDGTVSEDCTPPPPPCEPSDLHVEGEDGWTYDGCHWNQVIEESCYEPGLGPDAESDSSEPTIESMDNLYNADGSIYATWNGESWVGGDVGSEA